MVCILAACTLCTQLSYTRERERGGGGFLFSFFSLFLFFFFFVLDTGQDSLYEVTSYLYLPYLRKG